MLNYGSFGADSVYIACTELIAHLTGDSYPVLLLHINARNVSTVSYERTRHFRELSERSFDTVENIRDYSRGEGCRHRCSRTFHRLTGLQPRCRLIDLNSSVVRLNSDDLTDKSFLTDIDHFLHREGLCIGYLYYRSVY